MVRREHRRSVVLRRGVLGLFVSFWEFLCKELRLVVALPPPIVQSRTLVPWCCGPTKTRAGKHCFERQGEIYLDSTQPPRSELFYFILSPPPFSCAVDHFLLRREYVPEHRLRYQKHLPGCVNSDDCVTSVVSCMSERASARGNAAARPSSPSGEGGPGHLTCRAFLIFTGLTKLIRVVA